MALILFGVAFLLHNYRGFEFQAALLHWWPLLLIVLGLIKLYERTSSRYEPGAARITAGEIFLVIGLLLLVGIVVGVDTLKGKFSGSHLEFGDFGRNSYDYDLEVTPKTVPATARISVRGTPRSQYVGTAELGAAELGAVAWPGTVAITERFRMTDR